MLTLAAVLVTGNHWYVDAVAGVALTLLVAVVVRRVWPISPPTDGEGTARSSTSLLRHARATAAARCRQSTNSAAT